MSTQLSVEDLRLPGSRRIAVLPVRSLVLFPTGATALQISYPPNVELLNRFPGEGLLAGLVPDLSEGEETSLPLLNRIGTIARLNNRLLLPGGTVQVTLQGIQRVRLEKTQFKDGYYTALPRLVEEVQASNAEAEPVVERILALLEGVASRVERISEEVPRILRMNTADAGRFADLVAHLANFTVAEKAEVLSQLNVQERLQYVLGRITETWERVQDMGEPKGTPPKNAEERAAQIRKRIHALQAELGDVDPAERDAQGLMRKIEQAVLPAAVAATAKKEASRLPSVRSAAEAADIEAYVQTLLDMPWENSAEGSEMSLAEVSALLDQEFYGLREEKERLLEIIAVARRGGDLRGQIPCLTGPPYTGKRTLAEVLARALGRPLVRVELGGRGEAQLVGSRKNRPGAMLGKIMEALRDGGVKNPLFLLEEIDEIGLGKVEGDPVEALEEFLRPAHRHRFVDRYLDGPFDFSDVFFLATALDFYRIPRTLREHLFEIRLSGYTPEEKVEIAQLRFLPTLTSEMGLSVEDYELDPEMLPALARGYARDAGLGALKRNLSALLRYVAAERTRRPESPVRLDTDLLSKVLGLPRYQSTPAERKPDIGTVTGLAWTASGGEILLIEALKMQGSGRLVITGLLGEVMRESVSAACSYVRSRASALGITPETFPEHDLHIHFPQGATPKDGPSAGAAVTLAIASTISDRAVRHDIAMTGEVTLRGRILEIGGVKEKVLAAYRAGILEVILPKSNEKNLRDVPEEVRSQVKFHLVEHVDEVLELCLLPGPADRLTGPERSFQPERLTALPAWDNGAEGRA